MAEDKARQTGSSRRARPSKGVWDSACTARLNRSSKICRVSIRVRDQAWVEHVAEDQRVAISSGNSMDHSNRIRRILEASWAQLCQDRIPKVDKTKCGKEVVDLPAAVDSSEAKLRQLCSSQVDSSQVPNLLRRTYHDKIRNNRRRIQEVSTTCSKEHPELLVKDL